MARRGDAGPGGLRDGRTSRRHMAEGTPRPCSPCRGWEMWGPCRPPCYAM